MFAVSAPFDGLRGVIRLVDSAAALDSLVGSAGSLRDAGERVSVVMTQALFTTATVNRIRDTLDVAGIMLLRGDPPSSGYSSATPTPQLLPPPSSLLPSLSPYPSIPSAFNRSFAWNPLGDSMRSEYYPFAMLLVSSDDAGLLAKAQANEASVAAGSQAVWWAEFRDPSYAEGNSVDCLAGKGYCNPVGAQSIWATMFPLVNDTRDFVLAMAPLDSQSLFLQADVGAESAMSGVIVLLAAANALSLLWESNVTATALSNLTHNLLFFLPHAESFDHAGSRRLVDDLLHFECDDGAKVEAEDYGKVCLSPWVASFEFLQLRKNASDGRTGLGRVRRILEMGQVGLNASFYAHTERDVNPTRSRWVDEMMRLARNVTGLTLGLPASDTPGIPPSAAEAFLSAEPSIPAVVLADHRREFINRFHESQFDVGRTNLLHADGATDTSPSMCALATLVARTLFVAAGGNETFVPYIQADCSLVVSLLICLTIDSTCAELSPDFRPSNCAPNAPSHRPGIWFPNLPPGRYCWGCDASSANPCAGQLSSVYPNYFRSLFQRYFRNSSSSAYYHDALDPMLVYRYPDGFEVRQGNASRVWTVSNPIARTSRVYRVEENVVVWTMLGMGTALLIASVVGVLIARGWVTQHFKTV